MTPDITFLAFALCAALLIALGICVVYLLARVGDLVRWHKETTRSRVEEKRLATLLAGRIYDLERRLDAAGVPYPDARNNREPALSPSKGTLPPLGRGRA